MRWIAFLWAMAAWGQAETAIQSQMHSVARQREAVERQRGAAVPMAQTAPAGDCDTLDEAEASAMVESAAKAQKVPAKLVRAVIEQESGFKPCAVSKKGAKGLMQLMPSTAEQFSVAEPFDPEANVAAGTKYLRQLLDKYKGDLQLTLAAYNSGPGAVDAAGGVPNIAETKGYVDAIVGVMGIKQIELPSLAAAPPIAPPILLDAIHP